MITATAKRMNGNGKALQVDPETYFSEQAERGVLSCLFTDPACLSDLANLAPHHFHDRACGDLLTLLREIIREGGQPDTLLPALLAKARKIPDVDAVFLANIAAAEATSANVRMYAKQVIHDARRRQLASISEAIQQGLACDPTNLESIVTAARSDLDDIERSAGAEPPRPISLEQLAADYPHLARAIIDGWLRAGETGNIIAAPKIGKSWLAYLIALTVGTGGMLFGRFPCSCGRVLIIDNELFPSLIHRRIATVAKAAGIEEEDYRGCIDVLSLRGRLLDIHGIAAILAEVAAGEYDLVILDALYRAEPEGQTENDNSARMRLYNLIDGITAKLGSAWINVHHASKGDQSSKSVVDVGAGAGSQARAADTHLVLRQHEEPGIIVLEGAVRSFAPIEPLALRWEFPLWLSCDTVDPARLKGRLSAAEQKRGEADRADVAKIVRALEAGPQSETKLRAVIGSGRDRTQRLLAILETENRIQSKIKKANGGKARMYRLTKVTE